MKKGEMIVKDTFHNLTYRINKRKCDSDLLHAARYLEGNIKDALTNYQLNKIEICRHTNCVCGNHIEVTEWE